ncbi:hypothetical protein ACJMK2_016971 [Sinanodonta woodiana]|uniref:Uncharacterized protein n=1 Tax=Sinanodonta woodiana TaxID=1069815 RepID=A0ABD3UVE6_SINWO
MWLLYVTFEDFICIRHPDRSTALISSAVDIDTYFSGPLATKSAPSANSFSAFSYPCLQKDNTHSHCPGPRISNRPSISKDLIQTLPRRIGHLTYRAESSAFMVVHRKSDSYGEDSHLSDAYQSVISANAINHRNFDSVLETNEKQYLSKDNVVQAKYISDRARQNNCNQKVGPVCETKQVIGSLSYSEVDRDRCAFYDRRHPVCIFCHQLNQNDLPAAHINNKDQRQNTQRRGGIVCRAESIKFLQMHNPDLQGRYQLNDVSNGLNKLAFCGPAKRDRVMGIDIKSACIQTVDNIKGKARDYTLGVNNPQSNLCTAKLDNSICQLDGSETSSVCSKRDTDNVVSSNSSRQARLRVSVFDHSRIPSEIANRIHAARRREQGPPVINRDQSNAFFQKTLKSPDSDFIKRRGLYLPYAVIKTNHSNESAHGNSSEGNTGWESMQESIKSRTPFEELLGFVSDSVSNKTSPMTISSGYESDYKQSKENKTDPLLLNKAEPPKQCHRDEVPIDYFSLSDTYPKSENQSPVNAVIVTEKHDENAHTPSNTATLLRGPKCLTSLDKSKIRSDRLERDSQDNFSYTQRHNYKLTKVTRSMYEIIHDLQTEKGQLDSVKKSKKGKCVQHSKESAVTLNRSGVSLPDDNSLHETLNRKHSYSSANKNNTDNGLRSAASALCTRCVRRTFESETVLRRQRQNKNSYGEKNEVKSSPQLDNGSSFERQLRTLLCDIPEHVLTESNQTIDGSSNSIITVDQPPLEQTNWKITFMKENERSQHFQQGTVVTGIVLRGAMNKGRHVGKEDEHVYETIPGDEYLYEEMKRIRETSSANKIRRFTTVPDLPGTFIPKDPPALPERRYPRELPRDGENISVPDENSNYPNHQSFPTREYPHISPIPAGFGYASVSIESILEANFSPAGEDVPAQDRGVIQSHSKGDNSDGYCSIDNLSLMQQETRYEKPWGHLYPLLESNSEPSPFQHRNLCSNGWQARSTHVQCSSEGDRSVSLFSKPSDIGIRLDGLRWLENGKSDGSDSDSTLVPSSFDRHEARRPVIVQATYV